MMEALYSSETSVLTRATWRNIPEDDILHSHRRGNLKSHMALICWAMWQRRNVFPVRYKLVSFTPENEILHSQRPENPKS
jgi:hypothetical protein